MVTSTLEDGEADARAATLMLVLLARSAARREIFEGPLTPDPAESRARLEAINRALRAIPRAAWTRLVEAPEARPPDPIDELRPFLLRFVFGVLVRDLLPALEATPTLRALDLLESGDDSVGFVRAMWGGLRAEIGQPFARRLALVLDSRAFRAKLNVAAGRRRRSHVQLAIDAICEARPRGAAMSRRTLMRTARVLRLTDPEREERGQKAAATMRTRRAQ